MIRIAFRDAWRLYSKNFWDMLRYAVVELALCLLAFAPLLLVCAKETQLLALLCIPAFMLIVLPARQNAARCMQRALEGDSLFDKSLLFGGQYGKSLASGLKMLGLLLVWSIPFLAATGLFVYIYAGSIDILTVLRAAMALGNGSTMEGIKVALLLYACTLLPIVLGCAVHSGTRHALALGDRKLLKGHRFGVVMVWVLSLVTVLPFAAVAVWVGAGYISELVKALGNIAQGIVLPPLDQNLYVIIAAFAVLCLPLLPLRELITAAYVRQLKK